ncbi:MAG: hypothetical protein H0V62_03605 [Gammaproteobacteria bacterium]|nr:hypothetical protein [Gammaproteobacteria bacterium]
MKKRVYIGIVPAVLLKLLDSEAHAFSREELLVVDAIRRSDNDLADADHKQISDYIASFEEAQLQGFSNNVKGIYHDLRFVDSENSDGDSIKADIYALTNHPGADVRLINIETGAVTDIQLKATNSGHYVNDHVDRYPETEVRATEEVSSNGGSVESSGFSNSDLTEDVLATIENLTAADYYIEYAVATSGLVSGILNAKAALEGKQTCSVATRKTIEDLGVAGVSAAIIEMLVG